MSKQTTTDFREKISDILYQENEDSELEFHGERVREILSAVSELVEESFERILKNGHGGGNWRRLIELERQRLKERGIEIK